MKVVKTGSITNAANELNIAKSAVSVSLQKLESRLNLKLLNRSSRSLSLTVEGGRLLPLIESLLTEGERLFYEAEEEKASPSGSVHFTLPPDFAAVAIKYFVPKVVAKYPDLRIFSKLSYDFEDMQDSKFDFAIRIGNVKDEGLIARQLGGFRRTLVSSPMYLDQHPITTIDDLTQINGLLFVKSALEEIWNLTPMGENTPVMPIRVQGNFASPDFNIITQMTIEGHGVSFVPEFLAQEKIADGKLVRCLPQWQGRNIPVYLVYRQGMRRIRRVNAVLELAEKTLPDLLFSKTR